MLVKNFIISLVTISAVIFVPALSSAQNAQDLDKLLGAKTTDESPQQPDPKAADTMKDNATEALINKIGTGLSAISLSSKAPSLMLDADEHGNVDRAVESLKNNQTYTPDGQDDGTATASDDEKSKSKKEEEELAKLEEKRLQESERAYIYLASVMYFSPDSWTVWINNQKITPKDNNSGQEFYLASVEADKVKVLWTLSMSKWKIISGQKSESLAPKVNDKNQVEITFDLKPNQTFILSQNSVVEGKVNLRKNSKKAAKSSSSKKDKSDGEKMSS